MSELPETLPTRQRFGPFLFDRRAFQLTQRGTAVDLQRKVVEALALFLSSPGELISREQLRNALWSDVVVTDSSMAQVIRKLRRALGDDRRRPRYLQTVPGLGYRFIAAVRGAPVERDPTPGGHDPGFIGRTQPLADLTALWARHRWVTVLGCGGIGKTRLARHFAGRLARGADAPQGGVHFCDLARAADAASVLQAVWKEISGCPPTPDTDLLEALVHGTRRPTTLVLDNAEHVAKEVSQLVRALLARTEVSVITTSRVRLRCREERCLELGPLPPEEAVAMLRDRAEAVRLGLSCSLSDDVAESLVHALDGLPLAIEMVAPRLLTSSPAHVLHRLEAGLHWLTPFSSHAERRHSSLHAAVSWSFDQLSEDARRLCAQCARYEGPFQAAEVATDMNLEPGCDVEELLLDLRDRSLLAPTSTEGPLRFRLYRHIREYALRTA